jgi:hypothetical protein
MEKLNDADWHDKAAQGFLWLLVQIRVIFLQESVIFQE